jgi:sporulation protein YlmC with PRC-barrel domain
MRLADLLGARVVDADGAELGIVHDVGLVQDGPIVGTFGAALRAHWLLVGASATWSRLGVDRRSTHAPGLVKAIARIGARPWQVPWSAIDTIGDAEIRLRVTGDDLSRLRGLPGD